MSYLLFWIKAAARRFVSLFKTSPVIIIGAIVIVAAFIVARNDIAITLNTQRLIFAALFFVLVSLFLSLKKYPTKSLLIMYSKSKFRNKFIHVLFFVKQALFNNILLFIFDIVALKGIVKVEALTPLPIATVCSVVLSLLVMYLKNELYRKKVKKITFKKSIFGPAIKSSFHDYFTSDFFQTAVSSIGLFIIIAVRYIADIRFITQTGNQSLFFIGMVVILSIGFTGILDSIHNTNWNFFGIISSRNFSYHFKRAFVFLVLFFVPLIMLFVFMVSSAGIIFLVKYLYCLAVLLLSAIFISFTFMNIFYRLSAIITLLFIYILTVWISTLHIAYLPVLAVPVLIMFLKARNEYREWCYL
jgi:hypothetical protein